MPPKPHLTAASAFWESIGVPVEDQRLAASWAFPEPPAVTTPVGCAKLPEDRLRAYNALSAPASIERKPRRVLPGTVRLEALQALAEYAEPG